MDEKLNVTGPNGEELIIDVIDILEDEETGKSYIAYNIDGSDDSFISILNEQENSYSLEMIYDDEELERVEEALSSNNN